MPTYDELKSAYEDLFRLAADLVMTDPNRPERDRAFAALEAHLDDIESGNGE